jgi:acylaminoacyl-peptidase
MKRVVKSLAVVLVAAAAGPAWARPFTAQDLVTLDRVSDPKLSPDGKNVLFDLRTTDLAANKGRHAIWEVCADCAVPAPVRLGFSEGGASGAQWAPDGKAVYFLSGRGGSAQVWRSGLEAGAVAVQVTHLPLPVGSFAVAPDGRTLVVSLAVFPQCETPACTKARLDTQKADKASGQVYDKLFVRHWDEWADGTRNHLFALGLNAQGVTSGEPVALMAHFDGDSPSKPFGDEADYAISPDSKSLVFSARVAGKTEPWSTNFDLYAVTLDGSAAPKDLTAGNLAWDATPVFSPDGRMLAYRAQKRPGFEADRFGLMLLDLASGKSRELDAGWDRSVDTLAWAKDGSIYVTAAELGRTKLFRVDARTGAHEALTEEGHVGEVSAGAGIAVFARDSLAGPADLYAVAGGKTTRLTDANAKRLAGVEMAPYEQFEFSGWNNEAVHGYVMKPDGYVAGHKYPVAFIIHGGPQSSFADDWSFRWSPQFYAGLGYATVFIDFHGSTGYGQAFTDSISGHWGDRPLEDLKKGWAAALAKYSYLDGGRACALGASYGGYMVYWIAGNWSAPFKCLVDHDGVFDNRMMGYSTEELWFSEWENGHATPWAAPSGYEKFNPVNHVAAWNKPMLVIHSAQDFRIPLEQGLAAFSALQRKGVPSELLTFPDENHWVLKPANSLLWHKTVGDWLARWTGGAAQ